MKFWFNSYKAGSFAPASDQRLSTFDSSTQEKLEAWSCDCSSHHLLSKQPFFYLVKQIKRLHEFTHPLCHGIFFHLLNHWWRGCENHALGNHATSPPKLWALLGVRGSSSARGSAAVDRPEGVEDAGVEAGLADQKTHVNLGKKSCITLGPCNSNLGFHILLRSVSPSPTPESPAWRRRSRPGWLSPGSSTPPWWTSSGAFKKLSKLSASQYISLRGVAWIRFPPSLTRMNMDLKLQGLAEELTHGCENLPTAARGNKKAGLTQPKISPEAYYL